MYAGRAMERGDRRDACSGAAPPVHARAAGGDPARRAREERLTPIPGPAAEPDRRSRRVPVSPALRVRPRPLRDRDAAARRAAAAPGTISACWLARPRGRHARDRLASTLRLRAADPARRRARPRRGRRQGIPGDERRALRAAREKVHAVDGVSLEVRRGETLGLVGETGCGKSTLARCIMRLHDLTSGRVVVRRRRHHARCRAPGCGRTGGEMQMVFQDPYGSLNPRRRVGSIIGDPFDIHGIARRRGAQDARAGADGARRPQPGALQPVPGRVLRRSAPAHRHRPRARAASRS